jgi:3-isopropylmalate dehydrogenase
MVLRYSFGLDEAANGLGAAIAEGLRTADIKSDGCRVVSTSEMGDAIVAELAHQDAESLTDEEN